MSEWIRNATIVSATIVMTAFPALIYVGLQPDRRPLPVLLGPGQTEASARSFLESPLNKDEAFLDPKPVGIGRVEINVTGESSWRTSRCTASLLSDNYVLTARHCLTELSPPFTGLDIKAVRVRFGENSHSAEAVVWSVEPKPAEESDVAELDYAILKIIPDPASPSPTRLFAPIKVFPVPPKTGEHLYLAHYPDGRQLHVTRQNCSVEEMDEALQNLILGTHHEKGALAHRCDARIGSSGAPLFSVERQIVVALHHSGIGSDQKNVAKRLDLMIAESPLLQSLALKEKPLTRSEVAARAAKIRNATVNAVRKAIDAIDTAIKRFEVDDSVPDTDVLEAISAAEAEFQNIPAEWQNEPIVRAGHGRALLQMAKGHFTIGEVSDSLQKIETSKEIFTTLLDSNPGDLSLLRYLSAAWSRMGAAHEFQNNFEDAVLSYRQSIALIGRLVEEAEADVVPGYRAEMFTGLNKVGDILAKEDDFSGALTSYQEAQAIYLGLLKSDPGNPVFNHNVSVGHIKMGDTFMRQSRPKEAASAYNAGLKIRRELAENQPDNVTLARNLSIGLSRLATAQKALGKRRAARQSFESGQDILKQLAERDPSNPQWQTDLAYYERELALLDDGR